MSPIDGPRLRVLLLAGVLAVMLAGAGVASAGVTATAPAFSSASLATGSANQIYPETDANYVAYQTGNPLVLGSYNVVLHDIATGTNLTIGSGDGFNQRVPDVSQGRMVYEDYAGGDSDVMLYDAWFSLNIPIANGAAEEVMPRISGNLVAWYNESTDRVAYRDLARGVSGVVPDSSNVGYLDVDRGRIFWSDALITQNLYVFEPGFDTGSTNIWENLNGEDILSVRAYGDYGALTADGPTGIRAHRVSTTGSFGLSLAEDTSYPALFDDAIAIQQGSGQQDIRWYDWPKGGSSDTTVISADSSTESHPAIFGNRVVYQRNATIMNEDIYIATAPTEVTRTQGADRYLTAVEASKAYFHAADTAVLCTGRNFPDALAAGPFARVVNGPLLLTRADAVSTETMDELDRLGVSKVYIIGGSDVVSDAVKDQLEDAAITTERLEGPDRYATSVAVAEEMDSMLDGSYSVDMAFFARGDNFPDALAVGPVAAGALSPILLVRTGEVPPVVADAVNALDITSGVIVGGADVVSMDVRDDLRTLMVANGGDAMDPQIVDRWSGEDRYATAIAVIEEALAARWVDLDTVGIATGRNFPDALGGGAALGHYGSPVLLVKDPLPQSVIDWTGDNDDAIGRMDVFGGSDVVSEAVKNTLASLVD